MPVRRTALLLVLGMSLACGCHSLQTRVSDDMIAARNYRESLMAWWSVRHIYADNEPHLNDFGRGFRVGYENVANGGNGCPPTLPPQRYWAARYQDDYGHEQVVSWYNGYSHGVELALADGVGHRNEIVTSMQLYSHANPPTEIALPHPDELNAPQGTTYEEGVLVPEPTAPALSPTPNDLY